MYLNPKTEELLAHLRKLIEDAPAGAKLPGLEALEAEFAVSRRVSQGAYKVLREERVVVVRNGEGTFKV